MKLSPADQVIAGIGYQDGYANADMPEELIKVWNCEQFLIYRKARSYGVYACMINKRKKLRKAEVKLWRQLWMPIRVR